MKHRRKIGICPNCDTILSADSNFCPSCGQENHDLKVPIGHLLYETVESITHFDTKLVTTLKSIFTNPGKLTLDFLSGKRARHVHPVRFYIFISFVFFLMVNQNADKNFEDEQFMKKVENSEKVKISNLLDSTIIITNNFEEIEDVRLLNASDDSLKKSHDLKILLSASPKKLDSLLKTDRVDTTQANRQKLQAAIKLIDKAKVLETSKFRFFDATFTFKSETEKKEFKESIQYKTDTQLDSLINSKGLESNIFYRTALRKFANFDYSNKDQIKNIIHGFIKGISFSMFILMPLVAILLLMFVNRKKYFYEHLIFSIHIHAIYFLFFCLAFFLSYFFKDEDIQNSILSWTFLICIVYLIISLKKVYQKSWITTIFRFFIMSIPYSFIFSIVLLGSILYGLVSF